MKLSPFYTLTIAGALYAAPLIGAAGQQSLEKKVASTVSEVGEYQHTIQNEINEIKQLTEEAQKRNIDLSKEYARNSDEELLRTKIVLATRSLTWYTMFDLNNSTYEEELTEPILSTLAATEKAFGNHACKYPLIGRQKVIVQLLTGRDPLLGEGIEPIYKKVLKRTSEKVRFETRGEGYPIPKQYLSLLDKPIVSWEHWSNDFTRLDEISLKRIDAVPPEYREQHQKVGRR